MKKAIQLYSVRNMAQEDYMGTLEYLAEIGYDGIEFHGTVETNGGYSAKEIREKLDYLGLEPVSAHIWLNTLEENFDSLTDYYKEIGVKCIVSPSTGTYPIDTPEDVQFISEKLNSLAEKCILKGLEFAYHNHTHEFVEFSDEVTALDMLYDLTDPLLFCQLDVAWVQKAGKYNAPEYIRKYAGRVPYLHIKQYEDCVGEKRDAKISTLDKGQVDIKECVKTGQMMGCDWFIVEFDNPLISEKEDAKINIDFLKSIR